MLDLAVVETVASFPDILEDFMSVIEFGIVGAGWRTEFYLRIARALPNRFKIVGVVENETKKHKPFEQKWELPIFADIEGLLKKSSPSFVVAAVGWPSTPGVVLELSERGIPVLSETPPAPDLKGMLELNAKVKKDARIQVGEQYWVQPYFQACASLIKQGLLGKPTHTQISAAHGYHGISLIRRVLGIGFEAPKISGKHFTAPIVAGSGRQGPPEREQIKDSGQDIVFFDWGDRLGILDFTGDQYFGWIRNPRVLIRGERGEIVNDVVYYLKDFRTPMASELTRETTGANGNLEGFYLRGIRAAGEWAYYNPFAPAPLSDDELAIATCLEMMDEYVRTGREFYSLAEAMQDHYLNLLFQQAVKEGRELQAERQPWVK